MSDERNRHFDIKKVENGYIITVNSEVPTIYAGPLAGGYKPQSKQFICKDWEEVMTTLKPMVDK